MSCTIYLLRHGIAGPTPDGMTDADRQLTGTGERRMMKIAVGLKRLGVCPHAILSSPLLRAKQTADIVAPVLAPRCVVQLCEALAPGHHVADVVRALGRRRRDIMLVGHEPDLGHLASFLLTGSVQQLSLQFKKGGIAAIEVETLPPRGGTLLWLLTPKQLSRIAGGGG